MRRRRRKRRPKTKNVLFKHAQRRALQRYDLELTETLYNQFIGCIQSQNDRVRFIRKESNSRKHYLIDEKYIVVYDSLRHGITTFLPPEAIYQYLDEN